MDTNVIKTTFFCLLLLTTLFSSVSAREEKKVKFQLLYSPKSRSKCASVSNKYVYKTKNQKYQFKLSIIKDSLPKKFRNSYRYQKRLEVRIYSHEGLTEHKVPIKVIKFTSIINSNTSFDDDEDDFFDDFEEKDDSRLFYSFNLRAPGTKTKKRRRGFLGLGRKHSTVKEKPEFTNWNLVAVLYNKSRGEVMATTSYSLRLIPTDFSLYSKLEETSDFYSLPATPTSKLFDNFDGTQPEEITYVVDHSDKWTKTQGFEFGINVGVEVDSNFDFSLVNDMLGYDDNFHVSSLETPIVPWINFMFNKRKSRSKMISVGKNEIITNNFALSPGESGSIFTQFHVEESDYQVFGADRCGFLSNTGVERMQVVLPSYHLIPLDRTMYTDLEYLTKMADDYLPTYNYK